MLTCKPLVCEDLKQQGHRKLRVSRKLVARHVLCVAVEGERGCTKKEAELRGGKHALARLATGDWLGEVDDWLPLVVGVLS